MLLKEPLDTWLTAGLRDFAVPEAAGSSARVFVLDFPPLNGEYANFPAIKVMRPDKIGYAKPLFISEVRILDKMQDVPGISPLLGLGYLKVTDGNWPDEIPPITTSKARQASAEHLQGESVLYLPEEVGSFLKVMDEKLADGWLAFMILPRRWEDNLYLRCDSGYTRGEYHRTFSVQEALQSALQICKILQAAHARGIVYLDHKALHFYWNQPREQVMVLDWNIGRELTNGDNDEIIAFDILQFSARAFHHLMTGRQAPGSVQVGPNKPEEIQNSPHHYEPIWTYDDQKRLTQQEMDILGKAIQGEYRTAKALAKDLESLLDQRRSNA
jgi:serine/threonine protein kinase